MIKGLHHNAYRCRDSEETRTFYEDFLGLRMVSAFEINEGRALHTFFEMDDGSCLAFFEVPGSPFEFKRQELAGSAHRSRGRARDLRRDAGEGQGRGSRSARAGRPPFCPVDLFPRSQWVCHRIDRQHREARRDHGSGDLETARGAGALAGEKEPLIAPLRIAVIGGDIPASAGPVAEETLWVIVAATAEAGVVGLGCLTLSRRERMVAVEPFRGC